VPYTGVHLPPEAFSTQPLREDTGFVPQVSFEEGLRRAMAWLEKEEGNDER
jgi:nucleoside-diphosphate-sugar epimerase